MRYYETIIIYVIIGAILGIILNIFLLLLMVYNIQNKLVSDVSVIKTEILTAQKSSN